MALRGRAIPNRPIIGRAVFAPATPTVVSRTSYQGRPVFTGRPGAKATFGRAQLIPTPLPVIPCTVIHKPVFTGRPQAKATIVRLQAIATPAPVIRRFSFIGKPVFTGRPQSRFTAVRLQTAPQPTPVPALSRSSYIVKPVFTGRPKAKATFTPLKITSVVTPLGNHAREVRLLPKVLDDPTRLRYFSDLASTIINALLRQGYIVQTSSSPLNFALGRSGATVVTGAPTAIHDNTQGFMVGDLWFDEGGQHVYGAVSVATGAAVWKQLD